MNESFATQMLTDKIDELNQQIKRYEKGFEYLAEKAQKELDKEDRNIDTELLAIEIIRVFEDMKRYKFEL